MVVAGRLLFGVKCIYVTVHVAQLRETLVANRAPVGLVVQVHVRVVFEVAGNLDKFVAAIVQALINFERPPRLEVDDFEYRVEVVWDATKHFIDVAGPASSEMRVLIHGNKAEEFLFVQIEFGGR